MYGCAVGGRKVVPELAQQPQRELREGREAVSQTLLLGTQGPSELTPQALPIVGPAVSKALPRGAASNPMCLLLLASPSSASIVPPGSINASRHLHHPVLPLLCLCSTHFLCCSPLKCTTSFHHIPISVLHTACFLPYHAVRLFVFIPLPHLRAMYSTRTGLCPSLPALARAGPQHTFPDQHFQGTRPSLPAPGAGRPPLPSAPPCPPATPAGSRSPGCRSDDVGC